MTPTPTLRLRRGGSLPRRPGFSLLTGLRLGTINCADSLTNHRDHAFFATGFTDGGEQRLEPGEADLEVHWLPVRAVVEMVLAGELPHAGSSFAVLVARVRGLV